MEQIWELRGKYYLACQKSNITVKGISKASPSPKAKKKPRHGQLVPSASREDDDDLMACFQPLPDDFMMEVSESTPNGEALHMAFEKTPPTEKVHVKVSAYLSSFLKKKQAQGL